nr:GtrA family protein [Allorhizobium sonneratiae]
MRRLAHVAAFGVSGLLAFAVDAAVLELLTRQAHLSPYLARIPSVGLAMVAGWLANRRFSFKVKTRPSLTEFIRYAAASSLGVAINYAVFSALIRFIGLIPLEALVAASAIAAGVSYVGYRFFAFRT